MIETAKYCQRCIDTLFPATVKTEEEKVFLNTHTLTPRPLLTMVPSAKRDRVRSADSAL
jgi:hypothetical protein